MITLELTNDELQALAGLLDAGVRATGLRAVKEAASLLEKLEAATKEETDD
jgi:hypothetical protein